MLAILSVGAQQHWATPQDAWSGAERLGGLYFPAFCNFISTLYH